MRISRLWTTLAALPGLAACTHISTLPDTSVTPRDQALNGVPYALPMLQYKLDITRSLKKCPQQATLEGNAQVPSVTLTDTNLVFQVKVAPTARYVPWERYTADYRALSSFLKTTGYGIETYPSGVLKSVNVSADDHSAEVVKAAAVTGLTVATMGAGSPIAASALLTSLGTATVSSGTRGGGSRVITVRRVDKGYASALRALAALTTNTSVVVCTPEAIAALDAIKKNADAQDAATKALAAATKDVERFTILANLKKGRASDVSNLDDALKRQNARALELQALTDDRTGLDAAVAVSSTEYWPRKPLDDAEVLAPTTDEAAKFVKLLLVVPATTITPSNLQSWYQGLDKNLRKLIWDKNKALLKPFIREDGSLLPTSGPPVQTPCTTAAPDIGACVRDAMTITSALVSSTGERQPCAKGEAATTGCLSAVDVGKRQKVGRSAMDNVPDPGIFIRTPAEGLFTICRRADKPRDDCPIERRLARLDAVAAPQLGQLRFLPFSSRPFESSTLTVSLREDGSLEKLDYAKTKAAGTEIAATASDVATSVQTYLDKRDAKRATALTNARAEAIAQVQFQIDTLTKQAELLKLQTPASPDALAAINDETAKISAQTALLAAKLAQLKAEADLTAAGGE